MNKKQRRSKYLLDVIMIANATELKQSKHRIGQNEQHIPLSKPVVNSGAPVG